MTDNLFTTAMHWRSSGVSAIPVKPYSKQPIGKWKAYQKHLPAPYELARWFATGNVNLALITGGAAGLVVLDFDDGEHCAACNYWRWRKAHPELAESYTVRSGGGGFHVYFWCHKSTSAMYLNGIDVRAGGACVMSPPSTHPSGEPYTVWQGAPILSIPGISDAVDPGRDTRPENKKEDVGLPPIGLPDTFNVKLYRGVVQDIKARISILDVCNLYTTMTGPGNSGYHWGLCPLHDDTKPSFSCDTRVQRAHCWSTGCKLHSVNGLDVIDLVSLIENVSARDAIAMLARWVGLV